MINVFYYKIENVSAPFTEGDQKLFSLLSSRKADRVVSASSAEVRKTAFYGEILTLGLGLTRFGLDDNLSIEYSPNGKPFIRDWNFRFNISHTDGCLFIAFSDGEVGIDAEVIRPFDRRIAEKYFSEKELAFVAASQDKNEAFTRIWTRKEAYVKYTGKGIGKGRFKDADAFDKKGVTLSVDDKYIVSVFSDTEFEDVAVQEISFDVYCDIIDRLEATLCD